MTTWSTEPSTSSTDYPDWTLTLKHGAITSGAGATIAVTGQATVGVSWHIEGEAVAAPDSGSWEAAFYSNLPELQRTSDPQDEDAVPTGIAGTFEAAYHNVGKIIGSFGAHKELVDPLLGLRPAPSG